MADPQLVQCNACGGIYQPTQNDGTEYYHVCPPRRIVGSTPAPTKADPDAKAPVFAPIVNRRDENVVVIDAAGTVAIKSEGAGVAPVVDQNVIAAFTNPEGVE